MVENKKTVRLSVEWGEPSQADPNAYKWFLLDVKRENLKIALQLKDELEASKFDWDKETILFKMWEVSEHVKRIYKLDWTSPLWLEKIIK